MTGGYFQLPEAVEELLHAIRFYHEMQPGLGDELAADVRKAIHDVVDAPESWPVLAEVSPGLTVRSRKVGTFPYRLTYVVRGDEVVIIAYAHTRRAFGYWLGRIRS